MGRLGWGSVRWVLALAVFTTFLLPPLLLFPLRADAQRAAPVPVTSNFNVRIGGYVQTNVAWDTDENQDDNPSSFRELAVRRGLNQEHRETLRWAATRTRLFIDVRGPEVLGARTRAYTEFDWDGLKLNDDGQSSATAAHTPRLRHAYARLDWPVVYLVAGQTRLLINSAVGSESNFEGVSSSHGDITSGSRNRSPQFILGAVIPAGPAKVEIAGAVGRHATDQNPDNDDDSTVDDGQSLNDSGARSGLPALGGLVKASLPLFGREAILAVSGYWGEATLTDTNDGGTRAFKDVNSTGVAGEFFLPLPAAAGLTPDLRGAVFQAKNMSAWNMGHNGLTSTDPTGDVREIDAWGGWGEANLGLPMNFAVGVGIGYVEDDRDGVIRRGGANTVLDNTGKWLFAQWSAGPVLTELLFGRVDTTRINVAQRDEARTHSNTVLFLFRYRF